MTTQNDFEVLRTLIEQTHMPGNVPALHSELFAHQPHGSSQRKHDVDGSTTDRIKYQQAIDHVETLVTECVKRAGINRNQLKAELESLFCDLSSSDDVELREAAREIAYRSSRTWELITRISSSQINSAVRKHSGLR